MGDEATLADEQKGGDGGAHAALVGLFLAALENGQASRLHRVLENAEDVVRGDTRVMARVRVENVAPAVDRSAKLGHGNL